MNDLNENATVHGHAPPHVEDEVQVEVDAEEMELKTCGCARVRAGSDEIPSGSAAET